MFDEMFIKPKVPQSIKKILKDKPEMDLNIGIKETVEAIDFVIALANAIVKAYSDKKFSFTDLVYVIQPMTKVPAFINGIGMVPAELKDLNKEEKDVTPESNDNV